MSIYAASNSSLPSFVGIIGMGVSALSFLSVLVGGDAVIAISTRPEINAIFAVIAFFASGGIYKSQAPIAAWLGIGLLASLAVYANLQLNSKQAMNMVDAAANAATTGAKAATQRAANHHAIQRAQMPSTPKVQKKWTAIRELNKDQIAECLNKKNPRPWVSKPAGKRNCTKQPNGKYYIWRYQ